MATILLNYMPPAYLEIPSLGLSVLQKVLNRNGHDSRIIYWNIILNEYIKRFTGRKRTPENTVGKLLPFFYHISKCNGDNKIINKIKTMIHSEDDIENMIYNQNIDHDNVLEELISRISRELKRNHISSVKVLGLSSKFYQWIPGLIIAREAKKLNPSIRVVFGGFGNKEEAFEIMVLSRTIDYAIWGEGEYPLLDLCELIDNGTDDISNLQNLSRTVYRQNKKISVSRNSQTKYYDLSDKCNINYDDFMKHENKIEKPVSLPLELSRGCHWNKCNFCAMYNGYKYRERTVDSIVREMRYLSEKYNVYKFSIMDNDAVGSNIKRFNKLLEKLIVEKFENNIRYEIYSEINHKMLNKEIIRKMALAGFKGVQIGYEALSDNLLEGMNKSTRLGNTILFIKFALKYGIKVYGANILMNTLNESIDDIKDSIYNLRYLRYFLSENKINHHMISLQLERKSKYYHKVDDSSKIKWSYSPIAEMLPTGYFDYSNRFNLFQYRRDKIVNSTYWKMFSEAEKRYRKANITYKLFEYNGKLYYEEYINDGITSAKIIDDRLAVNILKIANNRVVGIDDINREIGRKQDKKEIIKSINELKDAGILYSNNDYNNIVTLIDVD